MSKLIDSSKIGTAGRMPGIPSQCDIRGSTDSLEESQFHIHNWYFTKEEIEDSSPSRKDGIDDEKESYLRKSYCLFLQELGIKLKVPQVTRACAVMLCHRFYMRQSHAKNDWQTIATASMFLASKLEETPQLLRDVVVVAYEIIYKGDPLTSQKIRRIEFYGKQKELIKCAEKLLLVTIAFDVDIKLPYLPLNNALRKLKMFPDIAKIAQDFVNYWLCTTLCLQYKPHYIAAGSLYLAAKFQKVKLSTEMGKVWWMEFDVSPKHLDVVIKEMSRLLQNKGNNLCLGRYRASFKTVSQQSTITSVSSANSHCSHGVVVESLDSHYRKISTEKDLPCQRGDCDSATSSTFKDGDCETQLKAGELSMSSGCKIMPVNKNSSYRIREAVKRRRSERAIDTLQGSQTLWTETELESGLFLHVSKHMKVS